MKDWIMNTKISDAESINKEKLMRDLRVVVNDAEELLRVTAGVAGDKVAAARDRIQENIAGAKARLSAAEETVVARTKEAARATDEYVHENPWKAVGIGAAVGVIVGMLIARGR
jgi:ElaB/YqjD/DUF883 family membrane-anchored ribosome-binding protein